MKKIFASILLLSIIVLGACSYSRSPEDSGYDPEDPGYEYNPGTDMYYSVPYDPLSQWELNTNTYNPDSINERYPVKGTIPYGKRDFYYQYANTLAGYEQAGKELHNPLEKNSANMAEGKRLYDIFCWHCHGETGGADGPVAKFITPPNYQSAYFSTLSEGKMYHSITYGKNLMGSHASQVNPEQRWKIIMYIQTLMKKPAAATAATTEKATDSKTN